MSAGERKAVIGVEDTYVENLVISLRDLTINAYFDSERLGRAESNTRRL